MTRREIRDLAERNRELEGVIEEIKGNLKNLKRGRETQKKAKRGETDRLLDELWREINSKKKEVGRLKGKGD